MTRCEFRHKYRQARIYVRDAGSRQKAAFWFHELAPLFSDASAPGSLPHPLPSGRVVLRDAPIGPAGRLP